MKFLLCLFYVFIMASTDDRRLNNILYESNIKLTVKMFSEVVKEKPDQSVVLSAFSVLTPLAQLALASVGESHDELLATIGMPNDTIIKAVFSSMYEKLKSLNGITLKTASKIYIANNFELNNNFSNLTKDIFGSEIENVDFTKNEDTAQEVNRWVGEQTNNRIKNLVDPSSLDANTKSLLVNAIYFKGLWDIPFKKGQTIDRDFHVSKEKIVKVPTMIIKENFGYIVDKELNAQVLELTYKGGESSLHILLPNEIDGIKQLAEKIKKPSQLNSVLGRKYKKKVQVYLPRFKIETIIDLKEILRKMNVTKLFSEKDAKLENLLKTVNSGLYISDAKQKAFIEVHEEGAEAGAANDFSDRILGGYPTFDANHPFIFFLTQENIVLFAGTFYS